MIRLLILSFFIYSDAVWSDPIEHKLLCKDAGEDPDSAVGVVLSFEGGIFSLENPDRRCKSEYVYREALDALGDSVIFSYPASDDMGLNAQVMIFAVSAKGGEAGYIGSIPASATELEGGSYKNVQQSGGSIYESIYRISGGKVLTLTPSKELIVSGEQCVYKEKNSSACQRVRGSFKHPVCIFDDGERKVLADASECADMSENL
ncbi:hypothetical protein [Pseudomonas sp. P9_31]|uniref:hypothetical protein n=1 Tax=Pseudomonas sp. P9_31 TaxID=3043448 RepID=UPI002A35C582|nr:hypothetical protein [Pseudomonas sp. P9_31]WPN57822.1 hypothetical protein QMK51_27545 [Pseudomonas sp. P9_31]